jgi:rod shape determining protein RodA
MFRLLKYLDWWLIAALLALATIGLFFIDSASFQLRQTSGVNFAQRQLTWLAIGGCLFMLFTLIDYRRLASASFIIYGAVFALLLLIAVLGEIRFGARRWIQLGAFTVQPSEFAKLALVLALSRYLSSASAQRLRWKFILVPCLLAAFPAVLILKQPDLGTALLLIPLTIGMVFIAGARIKHLVILALLFAVISPGFWIFLKDYQKNRLLVFLDPTRDPLGAGYTVIQSKIAIGSGGIWGKGRMQGTQNMLSFLPERQTDFIFSVVAEESGAAGSLAVLGLYALVVFRLYRIARASRDFIGKLLVAGCILVFSSHVLINVGMVMGLLPATGLPLPFLSYGGSITVTMLSLMGICQSVYIRRFWY